jgi:hypothetical protein
MKNSVQCPNFLIRKWIVASISGDTPGCNQWSNGPMIREVFEAEN